MDWIRENWFWLVVGGGFIWMHMGMHRGHSRHGGHGADAGRGADGGHGGCCGGGSEQPQDDHTGEEEERHAQH